MKDQKSLTMNLVLNCCHRRRRISEVKFNPEILPQWHSDKIARGKWASATMTQTNIQTCDMLNRGCKSRVSIHECLNSWFLLAWGKMKILRPWIFFHWIIIIVVGLCTNLNLCWRLKKITPPSSRVAARVSDVLWMLRFCWSSVHENR